MYALKDMKNRKSPGPDRIPSEILKLIEDQMYVPINFFNSIDKSGIIPEKWVLSTFVMLAKKINAKYRPDYYYCHYKYNGHKVKAFF